MSRNDHINITQLFCHKTMSRIININKIYLHPSKTVLELCHTLCHTLFHTLCHNFETLSHNRYITQQQCHTTMTSMSHNDHTMQPLVRVSELYHTTTTSLQRPHHCNTTFTSIQLPAVIGNGFRTLSHNNHITQRPQHCHITFTSI